MAVRDVPMSGTPDDDLPAAETEVDPETFAKRVMAVGEQKKSGSVDQTHYTAKSAWSTKARDAEIDEQLVSEGYGRVRADFDGNVISATGADVPPKRSKKQAKADSKQTVLADAKSAKKSAGLWFSDRFVRNVSILCGACLGAGWEVATMPATVTNFNKAVYAATGVSKIGGVAQHVDFYAAALDVLSAVAYFAANVGVALGSAVVAVRMLTVLTGAGESALNFVCIPFTWRYAVRGVDATTNAFNVFLTRYQRLSACVCVTAAVVEVFETAAPVITRGLCLGMAFSFFATEIMQFAGGFVWVAGLLAATAAVRFALRVVLNLVSKVFPPLEKLRDAMPVVSLVPGLMKVTHKLGTVTHRLGVGAGRAMAATRTAAAVAGKGAAARVSKKVSKKSPGGAGLVKSRLFTRSELPSRTVTSAGAAAAVTGAKIGALVGAAAAKTTVYGFIHGAEAGVQAGLACGGLVVKGTSAAGAAVVGAPAFVWRSAGKIRSFVRLVSVQLEVCLDPVAPKTRQAVSNGKFGNSAEKEEQRARQTQKLKL
jgi:hypothetical protein|tara:strand:- start:8179 stop:9798 length:1620 start_codon:yes stop_codon:yes gene_type:complete